MKNTGTDLTSRCRNILFGISAATLTAAFVVIRFAENGCVAAGTLLLIGAAAGISGYLAEAVAEDPSMTDGPFGSVSPDDDEPLWRHRPSGRRRY